MTNARRALAAVTLEDGIYAIGGYDGVNYLGVVERYDEEQDKWIVISSLICPRCTFAAATSFDKQSIYVFGGFNNGPIDLAER